LRPDVCRKAFLETPSNYRWQDSVVGQFEYPTMNWG